MEESFLQIIQEKHKSKADQLGKKLGRALSIVARAAGLLISLGIISSTILSLRSDSQP